MSNEHEEIKKGIKNIFDNIATKYDINKQFEISAQKMISIIDEKYDNLNILDLSTGTGTIAIKLAQIFPNSQIQGVDISNEMLNIAREKTKELGIKNIIYHQKDVEKLDFENIKFDIITCGYGLFFYPNIKDVFCDIFSQLQTSGKLIFSTFTSDAFEPYSKIFLDMLDNDYGIRPPKKIQENQLKTKEDIEKLTNLVNHSRVTINHVSIKFPMKIDQWWNLLNTTGYQGLLSQLELNYSKFEKKYLEHLKSMSKNNDIDFNANSFITIVDK